VPLNATYLFPLNKGGAVSAMKMEVGDELVMAVIQKKDEARKTFEQAKQVGKAAALLEQHRPNMFTQEIANLMPGLPVKITLTYSQAVPRIDGNYELVVPLVVGPRYRPAHHRGTHRRDRQRTAEVDIRPHDAPGDSIVPPQPVPARPRFGTWQLGPVPAYPGVSGLTIPPVVETDRVAITVNLKSALPLKDVTSVTHPLAIEGDENTQRITLAAGRTIDNRDFVLRYRLAGALPSAGLLAHRDKRGGFFSLLIEPPALPDASHINAREMVFILDTSGSMSGAPMETSKSFMRHALRGLRPADSFRIIRFSERASEFSTQPVPATTENIAAGLSFVNTLHAGGGTEMLSGLKMAYGAARGRDTLRIIVFLSDGYVSNEPEILRQVAANVGIGRMYAFGVGTSVNRYLIAEMARQGRGMHRIIDPTRTGNAEAIAFASRLKTPVLTDISIDWGDLKPSGVTPKLIPDLFAGGGIRIQGRFTQGGTHTVNVTGRVQGRTATMPVRITFPEATTKGPRVAGNGGAAIPILWARTRIADHMRELMIPRPMRQATTPTATAIAATGDDIKEKVIRLGLEFSLVTQWTSFVAVSTRIVNADAAAARNTNVPLNQVEGVGPEAYGLRSKRKSQAPNGTMPPQIRASFQPSKPTRVAFNGPGTSTFSGGSTPEPEQILGLGLILLLLAARFRALFRFRKPLRA
ncbi:MAG TPA: VIT and VWA domain-containing protein, partial [Hyphomicrobiaceae bacterium]|nr:VIT and VWA domain-containing protein [Hyphomicrobiaceae bacterium]